MLVFVCNIFKRRVDVFAGAGEHACEAGIEELDDGEHNVDFELHFRKRKKKFTNEKKHGRLLSDGASRVRFCDRVASFGVRRADSSVYSSRHDPHEDAAAL